MKAVILDSYAENPGDLSWEGLFEICDVAEYPRTDNSLVAQRIGDAEIAITNKTPIRESTMDSCPNLKYIAVLATGYDVIDIEAAEKRGIKVSNVPTYGTETVSQYAVALLLEICHNIGRHNESVHQGKWQSSIDWCFWESPLIELAGKTAGIIGLGRIGKSTARILTSLGMTILANDPFANEAASPGVSFVSLDELYQRSDVIILHCPLTEDNRKMINSHAINCMKNGVIIINNSRGALIDEADLADALNSGVVAAAAVDVVSKEPIADDNPLLSAKNCIITPHISWATKEARQRIMDTTIENVSAYMSGNPINLVTK